MKAFHCNEVKALTKLKELDVHAAFVSAGFEFEYQKYVPFKLCGINSDTSYAFLDFVFLKSWGIVALEIDEHQHSAYPPICDVRRDCDIHASFVLRFQQKVIILRYNPDAFKLDGKICSVTKKQRHALLVDLIKTWGVDPIGISREQSDPCVVWR